MALYTSWYECLIRIGVGFASMNCCYDGTTPETSKLSFNTKLLILQCTSSTTPRIPTTVVGKDVQFTMQTNQLLLKSDLETAVLSELQFTRDHIRLCHICTSDCLMVTVSAPVCALVMPVVARCINTEVETWKDGHRDKGCATEHSPFSTHALNRGSDFCYAKLCAACYVLLDECAYC